MGDKITEIQGVIGWLFLMIVGAFVLIVMQAFESKTRLDQLELQIEQLNTQAHSHSDQP